MPPGRYTLAVAAVSGFNAFTQENIEVNLSRGTTANVGLTLAGSTTNVDVIATPEIDQTTNTTGSNISTEFFSNIPTSRTVQGLYTIAPTVAVRAFATHRGVNATRRSPVRRARKTATSLTVSIRPTRHSAAAVLTFRSSSFRKSRSRPAAFGADQGLSTGGVFNVITKSGGNDFHGDVFAYGLPKSFVRDTKNFPFTGLAPNGYSELDAGVDIGGPIIKKTA